MAEQRAWRRPYVSNGLVEWNKFNDGSGTIAADSSGNSNALPLVGGPSWGSDYLSFNGSTQYGDAGSNQLSFLDLQVQKARLIASGVAVLDHTVETQIITAPRRAARQRGARCLPLESAAMVGCLRPSTDPLLTYTPAPGTVAAVARRIL